MSKLNVKEKKEPKKVKLKLDTTSVVKDLLKVPPTPMHTPIMGPSNPKYYLDPIKIIGLSDLKI